MARGSGDSHTAGRCEFEPFKVLKFPAGDKFYNDAERLAKKVNPD
jgi:hypothetical protein